MGTRQVTACTERIFMNTSPHGAGRPHARGHPERLEVIVGQPTSIRRQCLSCHVLGDPTIEGANKNPTAPNLTLTHLRLQRRWVRHWVQDPDIIQKGTSMPPFFTGLPIYATVTPDAKAPLGQSQPRAQQVPEPQATQIEEKYGKTVQELDG